MLRGAFCGHCSLPQSSKAVRTPRPSPAIASLRADFSKAACCLCTGASFGASGSRSRRGRERVDHHHAARVSNQSTARISVARFQNDTTARVSSAEGPVTGSTSSTVASGSGAIGNGAGSTPLMFRTRGGNVATFHSPASTSHHGTSIAGSSTSPPATPMTAYWSSRMPRIPSASSCRDSSGRSEYTLMPSTSGTSIAGQLRFDLAQRAQANAARYGFARLKQVGRARPLVGNLHIARRQPCSIRIICRRRRVSDSLSPYALRTQILCDP